MGYVSYYKGVKTWQDMTFNTGNIVPVVVFQELRKFLIYLTLIEIQTDSFKDFLDHGLKEVLKMYFQFQTLPTLWSWNLLVMKLGNQNIRWKKQRIHDASYSAPIL